MKSDTGAVIAVFRTGKLQRWMRYTVLSLLCSVFTGAPAVAELGGSHATLEADRAHLAATISATDAATYIMHTLTTTNGSVVREYSNNNGVVFAVGWRGPGRPDLRQLLGVSFDTFQTSITAARSDVTVSAEGAVVHHGRLRHALTVQQNDLVVHSAGHPGAFWGFAYLPQQLPAGFAPDALR